MDGNERRKNGFFLGEIIILDVDNISSFALLPRERIGEDRSTIHAYEILGSASAQR